MIKIFFDTEFTGLKKDTTLISIGLVSETGKSFYAELTDFDENAYNDHFLNQHVFANTMFLKTKPVNIQPKQFKGPDSLTVFGDKKFIRDALMTFFNECRNNSDENIQLVSDVCHYDMVLFIDIFGTAFDIPEFISPVCTDINSMIANYYKITEFEAFDKNREKILEENKITIPNKFTKHNSLYDALVIKEIFNICNVEE